MPKLNSHAYFNLLYHRPTLTAQASPRKSKQIELKETVIAIVGRLKVLLIRNRLLSLLWCDVGAVYSDPPGGGAVGPHS